MKKNIQLARKILRALFLIEKLKLLQWILPSLSNKRGQQ